jgi:GDP-4-dehydro-6-deoxy-D-mannose reductase
MTAALLKRGCTVTLSGLGARPAQSIVPPDAWAEAEWLTLDVRQEGDIRRLMESRPDVIVHLAGISFVPAAEEGPTMAYDVNVMGGVRLARAAAEARARGEIDPTVLIVGSGTQYGRHPDSAMPITEGAEMRPLSTYAATKAMQEIATLQIARASGLRLICTRSFNHSGVGHDAAFLLPSLVRRCRNLRGPDEPVSIGNDVVRDFLHVADVVDAYIALIERGAAGEVYNVCSGEGVTVRELASLVLQRLNRVNPVVVSEDLQRADEIPVLVGSPARLIAATGWSPSRTATDIIDGLLAATT